MSHRGFSLTGTLIAVAIGAIVASLVATVITEAVKGQRSIIDRDEMSEFSLYVKALLTNDSTCTDVMQNVVYPAAGAKTDLSIPRGYQDLAGPLTRDFTFSSNTLRIAELSVEDKGIPAVVMNVPSPLPSGATTVTRVMARIKLQLQHTNGTGYRARYFEIPVHLDAGRIVRCNNEFSAADSCAAMGFVYDPAPAPGEPACRPGGGCYSGGSFNCNTPNPATGDQTCPPGYTQVQSGASNVRLAICGKCCFFIQQCPSYHCVKC